MVAQTHHLSMQEVEAGGALSEFQASQGYRIRSVRHYLKKTKQKPSWCSEIPQSEHLGDRGRWISEFSDCELQNSQGYTEKLD